MLSKQEKIKEIYKIYANFVRKINALKKKRQEIIDQEKIRKVKEIIDI